MLPSSNLLQRGLEWIQQHTRRLVESLSSSEPQTVKQYDILQFPNLNLSKDTARNQGLRRARQKMGSKDRQEKARQKLKKVGIYWGKRDNKVDYGMELTCPICMDFMVGPVSTPCGHSFCWQCLDEAFILSTSIDESKLVCPVCRWNIEKMTFIRCIELQAVVVNFIRKTNPQLQSSYLSRLQMFEKWLKKRYIRIGSVYPSDLVDVRDTEGIWCPAVVKDIVHVGECTSLLVHYIGWSSLYDQIIDLGSRRLASYRFYTGRSKVPRYQLEGQSQIQGYVLGLQERQAAHSSDSEEEGFDQELEFASESSESINSPEDNDYELGSSRILEGCMNEE